MICAIWRRSAPGGGLCRNSLAARAIDPLELHLRYEAIASASLATALDRFAAGFGRWVDRRRRKIRPCARNFCRDWRGEYFSRRSGSHSSRPASRADCQLRAVAQDGGYRLDGVIPWAPGAAKAKFIVAGAVIEDGQQILFVLPTDLPGVSVEPPLELVALRSSWTSRVELHAAPRLERRWVLRGPVAKAISGLSRGFR